MQGLPPPVSASNYRNHAKAVDKAAITQASMKRAILEVREHYGVEPEAIADILISCDGTWQKRGFTSLYGAVFIIAYETGKVLDYTFMCKYCKGCMNWEQKDKTSQEYLTWRTVISALSTTVEVQGRWNLRAHWCTGVLLAVLCYGMQLCMIYASCYSCVLCIC